MNYEIKAGIFPLLFRIMSDIIPVKIIEFLFEITLDKPRCYLIYLF